MVEVVAEPDEDDDTNALVQTQPAKTKKGGKRDPEETKVAAKKAKIAAKDEHEGKNERGTSEEKKAKCGPPTSGARKLLATLMTAMEAMKVDEARACAQAILNRVQIMYQGLISDHVQNELPMDVQAVVTGWWQTGYKPVKKASRCKGRDILWIIGGGCCRRLCGASPG